MVENIFLFFLDKLLLILKLPPTICAPNKTGKFTEFPPNIANTVGKNPKLVPITTGNLEPILNPAKVLLDKFVKMLLLLLLT